MINLAQSIKDKLKNISKEKNIDFNLVMRFYMYDRFVERLSKSKYRDNFILKGGFYLSKLFGIDNRSTMDIDAALRKAKFSSENIIKMLTEILQMDLNDHVRFQIEKTEMIREEDEYGGLRITILFTLENIKDKFHIDIATGDPIYPGLNDYHYQSFISNEDYKVWAYSLETVLAEKIETILSKLEMSSRMKDYYDIYLIHKFMFQKMEKIKFQNAAKKTFEKRKFQGNLREYLNIVKNSSVLRERWASYAKKNSYAKDVSYDETIICLEAFINMLV